MCYIADTKYQRIKKEKGTQEEKSFKRGRYISWPLKDKTLRQSAKGEGNGACIHETGMVRAILCCGGR